MHPIDQIWKSVLTNGETVIELKFSKYGAGFDIPEGHILSQDSNGNMWLDGKPLKHQFVRVY